jgi:hypothetical protein
MSIQSEISRIQSAKSALKTSIVAKGVPVPDTTLLDGYSALVDQITQGSSGGTYTGTVKDGITSSEYPLAVCYVSGGSIVKITLTTDALKTITIDVGTPVALIQYNTKYTVTNASLNYTTGTSLGATGINMGIVLPTGDNFSIVSVAESGGGGK